VLTCIFAMGRNLSPACCGFERHLRRLQEPTRAEVEEGMQFTRSCLQESLRKYSIVPLLVRVAVRDTVLLGKHIPKGTKCSLMVSSTHKLWKEPDVFRPERFMPGGEFEQFPEDTRRYASACCFVASVTVASWLLAGLSGRHLFNLAIAIKQTHSAGYLAAVDTGAGADCREAAG
jgi:hypothetical protein